MKNYLKYQRQYFMPPIDCYDWVTKDSILQPPKWCSVDLRDGNQALIVPMSLEQKLEFFQILVELGFKEIEVGFPAASDTEFAFCRRLIEERLIPEDVSIQVLTQSREHIIRRTFEALDGCSHAIVHLYNSTSVAQREQVFRKSKQEIIDIAVTGAQLLQDYAARTSGSFQFEYSPESFTATEMEFACEICNQVLKVWQPDAEHKAIINLPVTVEHSLPHVYASQVEYMCKHLYNRECVDVSLHPHNDRGCAVADTELGLLAGADRVEGTLFGNGERTGNADIVTLALNLYSHGVDPGLDFSRLPQLAQAYERFTGMRVFDRQPYSGALVFAAFSGSHQDAISKGMVWRSEHSDIPWNVPYLPLDPKDIGREYEGDVIRINSQSGKGGIGFLLEQRYGFRLPKSMREDFGYAVKRVSDQAHKELQPEEILQIFNKRYVNIDCPLKIVTAHYQQGEQMQAQVTLEKNGQQFTCSGKGNGRLDAVSNAICEKFQLKFTILDYAEHSLAAGSGSQACCYVAIQLDDVVYWGAGIHTDIINTSVAALFSAVNRALNKSCNNG